MIPPLLSQALAEQGYDRLTPVQEAVTAPDAAGADLLVSAQTGSGKTVGFGLAIAPTLLGEAARFGPADLPLALVIAPTRELAAQVMRELTWLYAHTSAVVASCVGGMDMRTERRALERGAHLVVGTPGRLRDHLERGSLDLSALRAVILDEADEMLDMGFREDLEALLAQAPQQRRTLLFSATVSPGIARLAGQFQRDALRIQTGGGGDQHADIAYEAVRVAAPDTDNAVFNLLRFHAEDSAIVFANTRATVNHLSARLANRGLATVTLSGELSQTERTHALQAMRDGRARVCVATDVAARGIDLPKLTLVIHADLPTNTESLLHRSGRTGRAGRKGRSVLIVPPRAMRRAEQLLKWARIAAEWTEAPSAEAITARDEARLLEDPAWAAPVPPEDAAFAARLLARHGPEAVAAALVRQHRAGLAAPEDLLPADAPPARRTSGPMGPATWLALSVGRQDRAEPRWLLPLLCRAGRIERAAIGAIRVQETETFVEIAEAAAAPFMAALGPEATLEQGIRARRLEGPPDLSTTTAAPRPAGKPAGKSAGSRSGKPAGAGHTKAHARPKSPPKPHRGKGPTRPGSPPRKPGKGRPGP
ncbi:MAG: DEAD/DEAH box helicase [Alkalilacustris sp.]